MKIHWTDNCQSGACKNGNTPTAPLSRLAIVSRFSIMCAAWMCVASVTTIQAQSVEGLKQAGGFSPAAAEVQGGMLKLGDESYRVVDTASYRTAASSDSNDSSDIQQVGHSSGSCSTCGTSSCGGSCGTISMPTASCGTCGTTCGGSQGRCGLGLGSICSSNRNSGLSCQGALANDPCAPCVPYRYASVEALYMQRDDVSAGFNRAFPLPDFDYEFGPRIVLGAVYDCVNGYEASLVGPFQWDSSNQLATPQTLPRVIGPGTTTTNTTFSNQSQNLASEYFSVDASKTINGWEIAKLLVGGRYVDFSEDYQYTGTQNTVEQIFPATGLLPPDRITQTDITQTIDGGVENRMIGMQVGLDLLYPISRFAYSDVRMRAGAYGNFAEANFRTTGTRSQTSSPAFFTDTAGPEDIDFTSDDDAVELAGLFEFGTGIRYQLGELLSVRAGLEVWYLSGIASVADNDPRTGRGIDVDDDVLFTGLSFGSELRW